MIVKTESSKYELAHSVSTSIKAGLPLFKISASIKYGFESETSSSKEMAYTAVLAICRREKQYLDPNLDDKLATLRSALQSGFARDLNGQEAVISLPDKFGNISPYHVIPQDLNKGTKALSNVDLCYTRGSNHTPVTTIGADLNADCPSNEWEIVTWAGAREPADLNFQTTKHKKSIHLIMKHAGNIRDDLTGAKLCGLDGLDNNLEEEGTSSTPEPSYSGIDLPLLTDLSFGEHKVGSPYMPICGFTEWKTAEAPYGNGLALVYNTRCTSDGDLANYSKTQGPYFITRLVIYRTKEKLSLGTKLEFTDNKGITASYYPILQNVRLQGNQKPSFNLVSDGKSKNYYICYTYDKRYKPITDVKVMTSEDYTALCAKDKSYESYKGVVDTETRKAEPLFWTKESGLWIWIKRATSFDWSSIAP